LEEDSRIIKFRPRPEAKGRQLLGLLAGDATDAEIEEFCQYIVAEVQRREQEAAQSAKTPRRKRARPRQSKDAASEQP
jgi:hypothetical protein